MGENCTDQKQKTVGSETERVNKLVIASLSNRLLQPIRGHVSPIMRESAKNELGQHFPSKYSMTVIVNNREEKKKKKIHGVSITSISQIYGTQSDRLVELG